MSNSSGGGAGNSPAGNSAGSQAGVTGPAPVVALPLPPIPAAVWWDAYQKTFTENPDGTALEVDPIDQQVQTLITIEQGSIPSLGNVGQRYRRRLMGAPPQQVLTIVIDETNIALAALISAGDITLGTITVDQSVRGRYIISVQYVNNRPLNAFGANNTASTRTRTAQVQLGP